MIFIIITSRKNSGRRQICCSPTLTVVAMKSKQKISTKTFRMSYVRNSTLQIFRKIILQEFQQESTRKFQEFSRMRLVVKLLKSLSACERNCMLSRRSKGRRKSDARALRGASSKKASVSKITKKVYSPEDNS